jgi:hypothetical protein
VLLLGAFLVRASGASGPRSASARAASGGFKAGRPLLCTYYFYWYDDASRQHFLNSDGSDALTDHPPREEGYSYKSEAWHREQLSEMARAGIDVALPVYWGYPGGEAEWSLKGLEPMARAARSLIRDGLPCPRLGLFYDTSTLQFNPLGYHADLSTPEGRHWLCESAKLFFRAVPQDLWARIGQKPILWLYSGAFAAQQDPKALDTLRRSFKSEFHVEPFVVKEISWEGRADALYSWGAALDPTVFSVAALGPGYDHSAVPGRAPLKRDREGGAFYTRCWESLLARPKESRPSIAVIETWNEFHEGTDIAPSREYGHKYVDITRRFARMWHSGVRLPPQGEYARTSRVRVVLTGRNRDQGIRQVDRPDGLTEAVAIDELGARRTLPNPHGESRYLYLDVDNAFYFGDRVPVNVEVTYLDDAATPFGLDYDSTDAKALLAGAFKSAPPVARSGTGGWKKASFFLPDAAFTGRANGSDFRLSIVGGDLTVRSVVVERVKPSTKKLPSAARPPKAPGGAKPRKGSARS